MQNQPQAEIFSGVIDANTESQIQNFINNTRQNPAKLQQLAIDASHLLSNSEDRLVQQQNTGFFKRIVGAFTGKPNEIVRQNQSDIIEMQKFAWCYLRELQRQNLIAGKSIAVIRNNLVTMNDAIIETREFLEEAIDKINSRLTKVENKTELQDWGVAKEAEKRKLKIVPETVKTLLLTFDFIKNNYKYINNYSDMNYIFVSLDKLGIDLDEEISLNDFIYQLIEEIQVWGDEGKFADVISLNLDKLTLSNAYIQENIAGAGINALYYLSNNYLRISEVLSEVEDEEGRQRIVSKFFGEEFGHLSECYTIEQLVFEIVGGCLTAIDLYREESNLNEEDINLHLDSDKCYNVISGILSLPEITTHTWLVGQEKNKALYYLKALSLCCNTDSEKSVLFFKNLVDVSGVEIHYLSILSDRVNSEIYISDKEIMNNYLELEDDQYTLILDMMFACALSGMDLQNQFIGSVVTRTKPSNFREMYAVMVDLITSENQNDIVEAISKFNKISKAWKNIQHYRELNFSDLFNDLLADLLTLDSQSIEITLNLTKLSFKTMNECMSWGDENWASRKLIESARDSCLSELNKEREKAINSLNKFDSLMQNVSYWCRKFDIPTITYEYQISQSPYQLLSSVKNDNWTDLFDKYSTQINNALDVRGEVVDLAVEQLQLFARGEFDSSIMKIKQREKQLQEEQLRIEKISKLSTTIIVDGRERKVSIDWQKLKKCPFKASRVKNIVSDGRRWVVIDDDYKIYESLDGLEWQTLRTLSSKIYNIKCVDGVVFATGSGGFFFFSEKFTEWKKGKIPSVLEEFGCQDADGPIKYGDKWLWRITCRTEYKYTEKGFIWDNEHTGSYYKSFFYISDSLNGRWESWLDAPNVSNGVKIETIAAIPDSDLLMAFCKYDSSYLSDKKLGDEPNFAIYFNGEEWKAAEWNSEDIRWIDADAYFVKCNENYYCYFGGDVFKSKKGYSWKKFTADLHITKIFNVNGINLFNSNKLNTLYISNNLDEYRELLLEDGSWDNFSPKNDQILAVFTEDHHDYQIRIGKINMSE